MNRKKAIFLVIIIIFLANVAAFKYIYTSTNSQEEISKKMILNEARSQFRNMMYTKKWNLQYGGVYVQSDVLKPNKYLINNHLFTKNNEMLIKINHTWMTKQIAELLSKGGKYYYKITSLRPKNPENLADNFEKKALKKFEEDGTNEYYSFNKTNSKFNYISALKVEETCLSCHYTQGYNIGDNIGGIRITLPSNDYKIFVNDLKQEKRILETFMVCISIILILVIVFFINSIYNRQNEIQRISQKHKRLKDRYELAIEGSEDGLWDWDLNSNEVYFSKKWKEMLGYTNKELENSLETWERLVHPEDKEKAYEDIKNNQSGKTKNYENIHRLKHKNGDWVWILDRGKTIFNKENKATRMIGFHTNITKQKELEISLNHSQRNLLKAEKMASLAHWSLEIPSMQLTISENMKGLFGLDDKAPFGMKELFKTFIYEKDQERVSNKLTQSVKDKKPYSIEYRFKKHNKDEIRYISCKVEHEFENEKLIRAIATIQDVTDINLIKDELNILRTAIEHAPITFAITDEKGILKYANPCFEKTTGFSFEEAKYNKIRILKSEFTSEDEYKEVWKTISTGNTWSGTFKNLNKNNEEFWELAFISPIFSARQEIKNYLIIKQEITKEVFLKQELHNKEEMMIAQSRHAAMGEMISMIAHQWRQPIAVVAMGANNILADIELELLNTDTLKENLDEIISQTEYLSQTIDDFKNFFKPNKQKDLASVESIFDETFKVMGKMLENNEITVIQEYKSGMQLYTYSKELLQVFINIIKNAKEVLVEKREENRLIKINEYMKNDMIIIEISDNAGGIKEDIIDKIFDPYFTTKDQLGTGLGLYMSKTIIEKHLNGQLSVHNKKDGACFEMKFSIKDL